jgi:formylglycine-generating enzyme required for sulfatase activity
MQEIVNSVGMSLVLVPAGKFLMGSPDSDSDRYPNESPQHLVKITQPFYLGKFAVTRGQFQKFVEATGHQTEADKDGKGGGRYDADKRTVSCPVAGWNWLNTGFEQTDEHPVVNVSWNDARAFCAWLSQKEGKHYRLPTEAEWEYSCRAGSTTRFYSGDSEDSLCRVANIADQSLKRQWDYGSLQNKAFQKLLSDWFDRVSWDDGYPFTAPVGMFESNAFGLFDMHGNVWQWCEDRYDKDYYQNSPARNPRGPGTGSFHVLRGGSFSDPPRFCRAAFRIRSGPASRNFGIGFRVVRMRHRGDILSSVQQQ